MASILLLRGNNSHVLKGIKFIHLLFFFLLSPSLKAAESGDSTLQYNFSLRTGAERTELYLGKLRGKSVAVVANPTSMIGNVHLVDSLLALGISVKAVFAPEHGFRGNADAGEHISSSVDAKTGIPLISLYGNHKKPSAKDLEGIQLVIFDIQDVGARFYTYISTMHYVMEACAENTIELLVLDRPNPNGFYVDGPVLQKGFESFVGMHPVPIVHGMTIAEYALMINGEGWLANRAWCNLSYVPVAGYSHSDLYRLPVKPSPNLPDMASIYLYPSLCLFEGTVASVGRGTDKPFQVIGMPGNTKGDYVFTPSSRPGAKTPPHLGKECRGYDLSSNYGEVLNNRQLDLQWLSRLYRESPAKDSFFNAFFSKLAGNAVLRQQISAEMSEKEIRESWKADLEKFKKIRQKYLLYLDDVR
jgi:uncharacterized protein YbbC (DUF1343 family)